MVMRGGCSFKDKWIVLQELGAVGMIVVQDKQNNFPVQMEMGTEFDYWRVKPNGIGAPACMTFWYER